MAKERFAAGLEVNDSWVQKDRLRTQLKLLMFLRVVTVSVVLGLTVYLQILEKSVYIDPPLVMLYVLCVVFYALTIVYVWAIKKNAGLWRLAYAQLTLDVVFVGCLVFITRGYEIFSFLFILTIINSSIILGRRGALFIALLSGFLFALTIDLYYFRVVPLLGADPSGPVKWEEMGVTIFYNVSAYFIIALLSGSLSEQLQRADRHLKQKQTDLLDLENLNRHIVESLSSGLMTLNSDSLITSFNHCAEEITGYYFAEVFNQPVDRFFPGMKVLMEEEGGRWEGAFVRQTDHQKLMLGFSSSPLRHNNGQSLGRIINFQDVTVLRQMQEKIRESDKLAAIGRLAAGIAHEIRNPLASMSGSIQILREDLKPQGEDKQLMDIITREMERLNVLIREFLEFAKPKDSNVQIIDLRKVILETVAVGRQHLRSEPHKSIDLSVELGEDAVWVKADSGKLKQVLWNLLLNAFQAISEPRGKVELHLVQQGHRAFFEIRDSGCGISQAHLAFIYEPFFTTKTQGTGLGLATVRRIVEESEWMIDVQSSQGQGTSFRLTLPLGAAPEDQPQLVAKQDFN